MSVGIKSKDKIFIAGARGMVGSAIIRALKNSKYLSDSYEIKLLTPSKSEIDLRDSYKVEYWFEKNKPDLVIIAAAKVGGIFANSCFPVDFLLDNLRIQNNIINSSFRHKVRRLLFLGSSCIYPKDSKQPIKEEYLLDGPLEKTNQWYALAKISGVKLCEALRLQYGFDAISLMPTNLYGRGDNYNLNNSHVVPALINKFHLARVNDEKEVICWGTGNPLREFLYVDDLAEACIFVLENWFPSHINSPKDINNKPLQWLNVGSQDEVSIKNLAQIISKLMNYEGKIIWDTNKPDGTFRKKLDNSKIRELGWFPRFNLEKGLLKTIQFFEKDLNSQVLRL